MTGDFFWRMSINVIYFFITTVFMFALRKIKNMVTTVNVNERF